MVKIGSSAPFSKPVDKGIEFECVYCHRMFKSINGRNNHERTCASNPASPDPTRTCASKPDPMDEPKIPVPVDALKWISKSMKDRYLHHLPKCMHHSKTRCVPLGEKSKDGTVLVCPVCGFRVYWTPSPTWGYILALDAFMEGQ